MSEFRLPASTVGNREIKGSDNDQIEAHKLWNVFRQTERFGLKIGDAPTTQEVILFQADQSGRLEDDFFAMLDDTGTASVDVTFMPKKNGTNMCASAIQITHSDSDRSIKTGTWLSDAIRQYVRGDVISVLMTAVTVTGSPKGPAFTYSRLEKGA